MKLKLEERLHCPSSLNKNIKKRVHRLLTMQESLLYLNIVSVPKPPSEVVFFLPPERLRDGGHKINRLKKYIRTASAETNT